MAKLKMIWQVVLWSYCEHPMIQQGPDSKWYCTECKAQVG